MILCFFGIVFVPRSGHALFFGKRLSHDWDSKRNFSMGEGNVFFFLKKKKRLRHLPQSRPTVERTRKMFENHHRGFSQTTRHERNTRKDYEGESFEMRDNGVNSLTSPSKLGNFDLKFGQLFPAARRIGSMWIQKKNGGSKGTWPSGSY